MNRVDVIIEALAATPDVEKAYLEFVEMRRALPIEATPKIGSIITGGVAA